MPNESNSSLKLEGKRVVLLLQGGGALGAYEDWTWMAFNPSGQPNFFGSRVLNPLQNPWVQQWARPLVASELAFYDTEWLRRTLDKHVNWGSIDQDGGTRLSLGAARVRDDEVVFFNSFASQNPDWGPKAIRADHVLASGALPPGFPGISIDGELYWDGGVSSDTPIEELAEDLTADLTRDTIVFLIDLWDRKGAIPRSLDEVLWRQKCIQYGSRKSAAVSVVNTYQLEVEAHQAPSTHKLEVCQVMFERSRDDWTPQFSFADADFSRTTYEQMAKLGHEDMQRAIEHPHRVPGVGGAYAVLYRHGTHGKHHETDGKHAAIRKRKQQRMRAFSRDNAP